MEITQEQVQYYFEHDGVLSIIPDILKELLCEKMFEEFRGIMVRMAPTGLGADALPLVLDEMLNAVEGLSEVMSEIYNLGAIDDVLPAEYVDARVACIDEDLQKVSFRIITLIAVYILLREDQNAVA